MTTRDLLTYLRDELAKARRVGDAEALNGLMVTFSTLEEAACFSHDKAVAGLMTDMECAARDSLCGVDWKSVIPTDEQIINATKP